MKSRKNNEAKTVPLYDVDGKTVIGEFKLQKINVEDIIETKKR